jgi:hypothetical protein
MRCLGIIALVLSMAYPSIAFEIVGVGDDPFSAHLDAVRQIAECFGQVHVTSATKVVDLQTVSDWVDIDTQFSARQLDRYFVGISKDGEEYRTLYRFPKAMLRAKSRRDYYRKVVFITFERVGYTVINIDSLGEVSRREWVFKVPPWVRQFFRRCIWRISDDFNGFEWVTERR